MIGWTIGDEINTYRDSYDRMSLPELAGHVSHELCHVLDFSHEVKYSKDRDFSIPYQVGFWCENKAKELLNKNN